MAVVRGQPAHMRSADPQASRRHQGDPRADIKRDLYALAGDDMRGREAGTLDEMRASMWVAEEMRKIGLAPNGDMGSWFQWWNMRRTRISTTSSSVKLGGRTLALWTEITPRRTPPSTYRRRRSSSATAATPRWTCAARSPSRRSSLHHRPPFAPRRTPTSTTTPAPRSPRWATRSRGAARLASSSSPTRSPRSPSMASRRSSRAARTMWSAACRASREIRTPPVRRAQIRTPARRGRPFPSCSPTAPHWPICAPTASRSTSASAPRRSSIPR